MPNESVYYRKVQWGRFLLLFHSAVIAVFWLGTALFVRQDLWNVKFLLFAVLMWFLLVTTRDCISVILTGGELRVSSGLWGLKAKHIPLEDIDALEPFEVALPLLLTKGGVNERCLAVGRKGLRVTCKKGISFVFSTDEGEKIAYALKKAEKTASPDPALS